MAGYDLERLTPGGVAVEHHEGKVVTDGPWLILFLVNEDQPAAIVPAGAVVALKLCEGRCRDGGQ